MVRLVFSEDEGTEAASRDRYISTAQVREHVHDDCRSTVTEIQGEGAPRCPSALDLGTERGQAPSTLSSSKM